MHDNGPLCVYECVCVQLLDLLYLSLQPCYYYRAHLAPVYACVCICVCMRERERFRDSLLAEDVRQTG